MHPFFGAIKRKRENRLRNPNEQNKSNFATEFAPIRVCVAFRDHSPSNIERKRNLPNKGYCKFRGCSGQPFGRLRTGRGTE